MAFTYDPADRVRSAGNRTFEHDRDGNLIAERLGDWEVVHEYNGRNRLARSSGNLLGWTYDSHPPTEIAYTYDALDRRVSRTETTGTGWRPETLSTRYSYHGLLPQVANEVSVREGYEDDDDWERSTNDRSYTILGDTILSHVDRGRGDDDDYSNRTAWYHPDVRGSTVALSDRNGRVDAEYRYSAYGVVFGEDPTAGKLSGARPRGTAYLYTGSRLDAQTRFADYGYRDYAASLARFTSVDPIRDGRNWFAYVGGDPVNRVDVWGLKSGDVPSSSAVVQTAEGPVLQSQMDPSYGPCYFRACQGVIEQHLQAFLDLTEVYESKDELDDEPDPAVTHDWRVVDPVRIMEDTADRLGRPDITVTYLGTFDNPEDLPAQTDATVRVRIPSEGQGGHAQTGGPEGELTFDSWPGASMDNYLLWAYQINDGEQ